MEAIPESTRAPLGRVLAFLQQPGRLLLTGHVRPDGDALGATLALGRFLRRRRRQVVVAAAPGDFGSTAFLASCCAAVPPAEAAAREVSAIVTLDCGTLQRLPEALQPLARRLPTLNIDHHCTNTRFGAVNWVDGHASSCSEMVWRLARRAGWPFDRATAEALWVGLITDTGRFAHDSTRPCSLRCGADLLRHGVRTAWINDRLYGAFERRVLELKSLAFNSLEAWYDSRVAAVSLTHEDFVATGCTKADAEDIVEIPRSLRDCLVALFFNETAKPRVTRLSIRTREPLDATYLALRFGGGGHARAAGCTIPAPLAAAKAQIKALVGEWLDETQ